MNFDFVDSFAFGFAPFDLRRTERESTSLGLMKTVGVFEAKPHLSALVDDADRGRTTPIARKGKPVAGIVPGSAVVAHDH